MMEICPYCGETNATIKAHWDHVIKEHEAETMRKVSHWVAALHKRGGAMVLATESLQRLAEDQDAPPEFADDSFREQVALGLLRASMVPNLRGYLTMMRQRGESRDAWTAKDLLAELERLPLG